MKDQNWKNIEQSFDKKNKDQKPFPFEEFVRANKAEEEEKAMSLIGNKKLNQTVVDIRAVREQMKKNMPITEIARTLNMREEYVLLIAMNIQGRNSEKDITIARFIMEN